MCPSAEHEGDKDGHGWGLLSGAQGDSWRGLGEQSGLRGPGADVLRVEGVQQRGGECPALGWRVDSAQRVS